MDLNALKNTAWNTPPAGATYVAIDPSTGRHLRAATSDEASEFNSRNVFPFDNPTIVSTGALIDVHTGPGIWFGGAGF
jgi:hypothetical protein